MRLLDHPLRATLLAALVGAVVGGLLRALLGFDIHIDHLTED